MHKRGKLFYYDSTVADTSASQKPPYQAVEQSPDEGLRTFASLHRT
jgi:hypothetical protein